MSDHPRKLYRSRKNRVFAGIAGGLGHYFSIDPTLIRLVLILIFFFSGPPIVVLYFVSMLFIPKEPGAESDASTKETHWLEEQRGMLRTVLVIILVLIAISFLFWGSMFALHPMTRGWFWGWPTGY